MVENEAIKWAIAQSVMEVARVIMVLAVSKKGRRQNTKQKKMLKDRPPGAKQDHPYDNQYSTGVQKI